MKKISFFIPILIFLLFSVLGKRIFTTGTISPLTLVLVAVIVLGLLLMLKPKAKGAKPASNLEQKARGEFAKDAFADNPKLEAMFQSAIQDYSNSMPKSALTKLTKLAGLCTNDQEIYAVSMATAQCQLIIGKPLPAIREYTRALGLHPTAEVAMDLGSCHQRLGNLEKARDSYEFALELDPENLEARSRIATTYVADHDFATALAQAEMIIDRDDTHASALATAAICHGVLNNPIMYRHYTQLAVENGYNQKKIEETVTTLKKRM